jgi:hypothetical protein
MRFPLLLAVFAGAALGEDPTDLEQPLTSAKARQLREQGNAIWQGIQPLSEKLRTKQEVTPAEAAPALAPLEQAVDLFERSLREEWHGDTNRTLASAVKTYFKLRALAPSPEPPPDDAAKKKAEGEAEKARRERISDLRAFVMEYGRERQAASLFRRCPTCDGRKEMRSPFGDRRDCTACAKRGILLDREGIVKARWIRWGPLRRADSRHERDLNRLLRTKAGEDVFGPYVRSVAIKEVEDHDQWARVKTQEQTHVAYGAQKTEKTDAVYLLYRVGRVWYLYDQRADRELMDLEGK